MSDSWQYQPLRDVQTRERELHRRGYRQKQRVNAREWRREKEIENGFAELGENGGGNSLGEEIKNSQPGIQARDRHSGREQVFLSNCWHRSCQYGPLPVLPYYVSAAGIAEYRVGGAENFQFTHNLDIYIYIWEKTSEKCDVPERYRL